MKLVKYILGLAIFAGGLTLTSCDQKNEGPVYDNGIYDNVEFTAEAFSESTDTTAITVPVTLSRTKTNSAYTAKVIKTQICAYGPSEGGEGLPSEIYIDDDEVTLTYISEDGGSKTTETMTKSEYEAQGGVKVTWDESVTFAAGEDRAICNVKFSNMDSHGFTYYIYLTLSDTDKATANPYNTNGVISETHVEVLCAGWFDAGTCIFYDLIFSEGDAYAEVPVLHAGGTNKYQLVSPWWYVWGDEEEASKDNVVFYLQSDNSITMEEGYWGVNLWGYQLYYDSKNNPTYCYTQLDNGIYNVGCLLVYGSSKYAGGFAFDWDKE